MGGGSSKSYDEGQSRGKMLRVPAFKADVRVPLFNGLLYRLENTGTSEWAFFNNSRDYEFHITYLFGADSEIEALGDATMEVQDDGILCQVVVYPLETRLLMAGTPDGYESKLEALPLSEEYFGNHPELDERAYYRRLDIPKAKQF